MEEAERLAAEARKREEERLQKAIEEARKREEEEKLRAEEEEKSRKEKEEAERKAREEAARKQEELAEKHKREEEERLARKKRIEEIMARTRGNKPATPVSTPKKVREPTVLRTRCHMYSQKYCVIPAPDNCELRTRPVIVCTSLQGSIVHCKERLNCDERI